MKVVVVSDTHAPRRWKAVPRELAAELRDADHVLHAGDVCTIDVLDALAAFAPVTVVQGNNDGVEMASWGATPTARFTLSGVRIGMVHDSGQKERRASRMHQMFPDADVVVFGHSHIPWQTSEVVGDHAFLLLNPGSVTDPRRQPRGSFLVLSLDDGRVDGVRLVEVARGSGRG